MRNPMLIALLAAVTTVPALTFGKLTTNMLQSRHRAGVMIFETTPNLESAMLALFLANAEPQATFRSGLVDMVRPAQSAEAEDEQACAQLSAFAEKAMKEVPKMVDAYTRVDGIAVICAAKMLTTAKYILLTTAQMKDGWQAIKQAQWNRQNCDAPYSRALIDRGWTMQQVFTFRTGERFVLNARCN